MERRPMPAALDVELLPRADRCPHRQPGGLDQVLHLVPAAQDVVVAVAVTTLVATAALTKASALRRLSRRR
jgi:hypothetical protein